MVANQAIGRLIDCYFNTMMTSSNGNIFRVTGPLCGEFAGHRCILHTKARSPVNSPHNKGHWRGNLMLSLICAKRNDWVNNRHAGDLRRHRGHYDVTVIMNFNTLLLKQNSPDLANDILKCFSWTKSFTTWFKLKWSLFPHITHSHLFG